MTAARRLVLAPGELDLLARLLGLELPPGFAVRDGTGDRARLAALGALVDGRVHASVAAGLEAACAPRLAVLVEAAVPDVAVTAALGVRGDVGGALVRTGPDAVEASLWPAVALRAELARLVPPAGEHGSLRATVVAPPDVVGQALWSARDGAWLALQPGGATTAVGATDLGPALAPLVGAALVGAALA